MRTIDGNIYICDIYLKFSYTSSTAIELQEKIQLVNLSQMIHLL